MATIKLKFRPSAIAERTGSLVYQITHERKVLRLKSKHRVYSSEWDAAKSDLIVPPLRSLRHDVMVQIKADVHWELRRLNAIAGALQAQGEKFTCEDIAAEFGKAGNSCTAFSFFRKQIEHLKRVGRVRSSEMLYSTLNCLARFRGGVDFPLSMLDCEMMQSFEAYMKRQGLCRNTIGFYMRTLRTYYNIATDNNLTENRRPFRHVYTSKDKTIKRALSVSEIRRICSLDLSSKPHLDFARDMLLFSFYARGMSFVDMAYLRQSDLQGDHFVYSRRKTGQKLCVEWIDQMQKIISKYAQSSTGYLLPIITRSDLDARKQYLSKSQCINRSLVRIGQMANVSGVCTLYRARHSWATMARFQNVPLAVISEALGHDNERTTEIYLDSIQTSVVDKVNRQLVQSLF